MGYQVPTIAPISSSWQDHKNRRPNPSTEPGTDYACAYGSTISAAGAGRVVDVDHNPDGAAGRRVTIDLDDGRRVSYIHLSQILVSVGQRVSRGQALAKSGASAWGSEWGVGAHTHTTLWGSQAYVFRTDATLDFERYIGDGIAALEYSLKVAREQAWMNEARGEKLIVDGLRGDFTIAATKRYQEFLRSYGYTGKIDGDWGDGTQAAHAKYYAEKRTPAQPQYSNVSVARLGEIGDVRGLQKIAKLYGYAGRIDNDWGPGSQAGFQKFLNQNHAGSVATWLRARWGYVGNDQLGPVMTEALRRANAANLAQL